MDWGLVFGFTATIFTIVGLVYTIVRNFKADGDSKFKKMEERMNANDLRTTNQIISLEERMFWLATGKRLEDALMEEANKRKKGFKPQDLTHSEI
jgi:hypothetical protein